ncbi:hypothetical protein MSG28_010573 [Choristoneura fumiferana]|uniref:Uncharacterized protein n=1 Tax=Choristoneura fumiferana TaxID=7141 RepID=A0ACC0KMT5_CHOFU|nr:hypothetical protein MSG28_010573 [Choristoneura fumiferana]
MKLYCLSSDAAKPCFVLSFKELLIMLDCGLAAHSVLNFLPLPPVPSTRLAALPSYTPPHITDPLLDGELKECCGRVFVDSAPEWVPPLDKVVDFAQLDVLLVSNYTCMLALPFVLDAPGFRGQVLATEPTGGAAARRWKELLHVLPPPLAHALRPRAWRRLYAPDALRRALARVRVVGYDERVDIYGALDATPVSSGFCLGSANWVLRSAHEKCLGAHLEAAGLAHVPLYVLSEVADASLAYSNILAEWVSQAKQPFPHAGLARAGRLRRARRLHEDAFSRDFRQPCVVFAGHPSLRFGAAVHLLELWAAQPQHAVIFTEPDFPYLEALAPFQPLAMKAFHCPIDTSLNYSQANKLVRELRPRGLALPEQYAAGAGGAGGPAARTSAPTCPPCCCGAAARPAWGCGGGWRAACWRARWRPAAARARCGRACAPRPCMRCWPCATRAWSCSRRAPRRPRTLQVSVCRIAVRAAARHAWSGVSLDVEAFVRELAREGLTDARVEAAGAGAVRRGRGRGAGAGGAVLHLPRHDTLVVLERHSTHVFCEARARPRAAGAAQGAQGLPQPS